MILTIVVIVAYFGILVAIGFIGMAKTRSVEELYVGGMRIGGALNSALLLHNIL
jgi:Na+/proline symporter